jgi:SAM-dependent methyltransferase
MVGDTMSDIDRNAFRDFERSAHDRLADSYHAFFTPVTEHAAEPLLTAAKIRAQMSVLDVACGSGVVAMHAARRGASVTGVDLAPRMLELAARLNPGCTFREASADSMPFEEGTFDAVVCAFGIGHFPDPPAAVAECVRVTRAGTMCAFAWWDLPARNRMHGVLLAALEEVNPKPPADLPAGPPLFRYSEDDASDVCSNPLDCGRSALRRMASVGVCPVPRPFGRDPWDAWRATPPLSTRRRRRFASKSARRSSGMPMHTLQLMVFTSRWRSKCARDARQAPS